MSTYLRDRKEYGLAVYRLNGVKYKTMDNGVKGTFVLLYASRSSFLCSRNDRNDADNYFLIGKAWFNTLL